MQWLVRGETQVPPGRQWLTQAEAARASGMRFTKRRNEVSEAEARARVVEALMQADEETKKKLAAAAERAGKDKERAVAQAVKMALEEQAAKEGSDE